MTQCKICLEGSLEADVEGPSEVSAHNDDPNIYF